MNAAPGSSDPRAHLVADESLLELPVSMDGARNEVVEVVGLVALA